MELAKAVVSKPRWQKTPFFLASQILMIVNKGNKFGFDIIVHIVVKVVVFGD